MTKGRIAVVQPFASPGVSPESPCQKLAIRASYVLGSGHARRLCRSNVPTSNNQHAESAVVQDAFDHCGKRRIDGVKALSNKVGGCRLSRPNEIAVPEVGYVSDVVTRWRRHPPEIGITIVLPNMNLFHQALRWQLVRPCSGWSEIVEAAARTKTLRIESSR